MKILLFSDVHVGTSSESTTNPGHIRLASTQAAKTLDAAISNWNSKNLDVVFQMGDILRETHDKTIDEKNIEIATSLFSQINVTVIHVVGNHDMRAFSKQRLLELFEKYNLNSSFFGSTLIENYQLLWLESEMDESEKGYISDEQLSWLSTQLHSDIPTIIFSHYSIIEPDFKSNFLFKDYPVGGYYKNSQEILELIANKNVVACFNAHSHWFAYKKQANIHFITIPAFSENIAAMDYPENNPGVYSVLEVTDNKLLFKSFSKEFAFVNVELEF